MLIRKIGFAALSIALITGSGVALASEKEWKNTPQNWSWGAEPQCKLKVTQVSQPNESQPIHVTVVNVSQVRLQYSLQVRVVRAGKEVFKDTIMVDNANPGESSMRPTSQRLQGTLAGASVRLSLQSCSLRS
ncbi:MAG TPA: hypothetical protein PK347_10265 [Burkholderiaceae bacterium]|nr:hypothetical protein [Burkholderiaceae bacterium]